MSKKSSSFRIGRVQAYLRGRIWYLCYHENGERHRPRVGPDPNNARKMAAQINAQLEVGAPAALSFEAIAIAELRQRWLDYHEQILCSSVQTVNRYRSATDHLLRFLEGVRPIRYASHFRSCHAEEFVRYLRSLKVSPNGHPNTEKRPLRDKGIRYILETCRALFNFAAKRRHLSPYADNPFATLEIDRLPVSQTSPILLFTPEQEGSFLLACDDWQFSVFLTLMLTGLRPGELTHLLLPHDLDLNKGVLRVCNKPRLGWQVKTRNEREVPLVAELVGVLHRIVGNRPTGPVFRRRLWTKTGNPEIGEAPQEMLEELLQQRLADCEQDFGQALCKRDQLRLARRLWVEMGVVREDTIRSEYMRLTKTIGLPKCTAPKMLRHMLATTLQEGRVDPLIRNELLGHASANDKRAGHGLGMTAVYTHTRPQTCRQQLEEALQTRMAITVARRWLARRRQPPETRSNVG